MPGRRKYTPEALVEAVEAVKSGAMSTSRAAKVFGVPRTTIVDRKTGKRTSTPKRGRKCSIPLHLEKKVVDKVMAAAESGFPLTKRQVLIRMGTLAKTLKLKTQFRGVPGNDYWRGLKERFPKLRLRSAESLSVSRMRMMNRVVVENYFRDYGDLVNKLGIAKNPERIWNADESGITFQHDPVKVVAGAGSKVSAGTSQNRDNITIMATINAAGQAMPPMIIAKGKTSNSLHKFATYDAPHQSVWTYQASGWMTENISKKWFDDVFLKFCGPERPQLLLLDGHSSHEVIDLLEKAQQENIHVMALPPHTTHFLQPLDRGVFGPLKKHYNRECTEFLSQSTIHAVNKTSWPKLFNLAWSATMRQEVITNAFAATGLYPFKPEVIPKEAFAPSEAMFAEDSSSIPLPSTSTATITAAPQPVPLPSTSTATITAAPQPVPLPSTSTATITAAPQPVPLPSTPTATITAAPQPVPLPSTPTATITAAPQPVPLPSIPTATITAAPQPVPLPSTSTASITAAPLIADETLNWNASSPHSTIGTADITPASESGHSSQMSDSDPFLSPAVLDFVCTLDSSLSFSTSPLDPDNLGSKDVLQRENMELGAVPVASDISNLLSMVTQSDTELNFEVVPDPDAAVAELFSASPPSAKPTPTPKRKSKAITTHRLMTSDEVIMEKKRKEEEKVRKAEEKEARKQQRMLKKMTQTNKSKKK
ncbi:uncharacterized protein LOC143274850 [Babylonia areolata]|uniref:uncharacterized protein LOC143274850 n=1 Tax=Babylonia areolata TaxID=304850 RepID=UPI003FD11FDB